MLWVKIKRVIKAGFINFWRNGSVTVASTLVMAVTLGVITSIIFVGALLNSTLQGIREKVDINVYFVQGAGEEDIFALREQIDELPEVESITYTSAEQALANFREKHQDNDLILDALDEIKANPLGASLNIRAKDPSQYEAIATFIEAQDISGNRSSVVEKVNYSQNRAAIDALTRIIDSSERLGSIVAIFFALISILIIFNTIRLAIYTSKEEIAVMRLVGASYRYIRGPFLITGVIYGLVASIITLIIAYPVTYWVGPMTVSLGTGLNAYNYYLSNFFEIAGAVILIGVGLGIISSYLAVKKYLKRV